MTAPAVSRVDVLSAMAVAAKRLRVADPYGLQPGPKTADELDEARAAVAELIEENKKLKIQNGLRQRAVDRWVPCPDHRDKTKGGLCYVCENESLRARLTAEQEAKA